MLSSSDRCPAPSAPRRGGEGSVPTEEPDGPAPVLPREQRQKTPPDPPAVSSPVVRVNVFLPLSGVEGGRGGGGCEGKPRSLTNFFPFRDGDLIILYVEVDRYAVARSMLPSLREENENALVPA
jgi:hypothetical protein